MRQWIESALVQWQSPDRCQAIAWTNARIFTIGPLEKNFSEILIEIDIFSFKKMHLKMSSGKWRPFCIGLNAVTISTPKCQYKWCAMNTTSGSINTLAPDVLLFLQMQEQTTTLWKLTFVRLLRRLKKKNCENVLILITTSTTVYRKMIYHHLPNRNYKKTNFNQTSYIHQIPLRLFNCTFICRETACLSQICMWTCFLRTSIKFWSSQIVYIT